MKKKSLLSLIAFFAISIHVKAQTITSTIAEARKVTAGKAVTVAGRVTATTQFGSTAYIQDGSAGIAVFNSTFANNVAIGDSVKVSG
jgi:hypothetical protein